MSEGGKSGKATDEGYRQQRRLVRQCVLSILYQSETVDDWQWSARQAEDFWRHLPEFSESEKDRIAAPERRKNRELVEALAGGVLRERENLDKTIMAAARNWSISRMSIVDRNILRLAVYEIKHCPDIPSVASLNEAIELARTFGDKDSPRFVNGILDHVLKLG